MIVHETTLVDARLIEIRSHGDDRGCFFEAWNAARYRDAGLPASFVQSNISVSARGVLRGLHAQCPTPQGKLITALQGRIWDAIVDARPGSPTYLQWEGFELSAENRHQLWVPPGFLHGFLALEEGTVVNYLVTDPYDPTGDLSVAWNDAQLGVAWPIEEVGTPILSPKDAAAPPFASIPSDRLVSF